MLMEEARWFGAHLTRLPLDQLSPMLNVGSSTERFRTTDQPWIDEMIFRPFQDRGGNVVHMDLKSAPGVNVVADLSDPSALTEVRALGLRSVFCSNVLEHLADRRPVVDALNALVPEGGYLFISVPYRYPRHDDPLDTMYRPSVEQLAGNFPAFDVSAGESVSGGTYYDLLGRSPLRLARTLARACLPMYAPDRWVSTMRHLAWLARNFEETCVILQRKARL